MLYLTNRPNAVSVIFELFNYFKKNIDESLIAEELEKHPEYASLLAVSDVLTVLGVENAAANVSFDDLSDLSLPFIAHTNYPDSQFLLVTGMESGKVALSGGKWNRRKESLTEFKKHFTGVVLIVEEPGDVQSQPRKSLLDKVFSPQAGGLLLLSIFLTGVIFKSGFFGGDLTWQTLFLTLIKSAGLAVSVLLLIQTVDSNNPLIQKICKSGEKVDCDAILSSPAAKISANLSWSEVGFFYYSGTLLLLLFGGFTPFIREVIVLLNIAGLPYTFYSIYYQAKIKKWCLLCCTVQALLWIELIPNLPPFPIRSFALPGTSEFVTAFICLILPAALWIMTKPLLMEARQASTLKDQLRSFKYNTDTFSSILGEQPKYIMPNQEWSIVLGNAEASNTITMVTNPFCEPCSAAHELLHELLEQRKDLQARIVFISKDINPATPVGSHLMALSKLADKTIVKNALKDWYGQKQKNYALWAKNYPVELTGDEQGEIEKHREWCDIAKVQGTPTMLLNGAYLPQQYKVSDLKYMLEFS
ncbi:thioredoxin domain-containing protein [Mucilaginibacter rubeus]|uniref:Thioredoxin domain-containing protein n=2 Tax=Mucilaginibacter TaxID=423349 RepID=A0AAE6JIC0_9SPHI|nr:vitamin K epoxide reductase family protein [Mucilaginibacter rubeus]QEM05986.1 thioredoxin domain-containing protein [Mucilaginibacter rubeus]QTE44892.1 thioredoxin domain-containing protein [Mucilaginibacter rubeus]QTE51490.1 thioredoxin domain-containing protein [Mucilaginibacter rubeus]QTE56576.1 thioredoxin domain-containing protein [Mucilaginibacter rubeus]QTE63962.1 thioredoxin domain-containing protein [Mucilaginibacter rubeus]